MYPNSLSNPSTNSKIMENPHAHHQNSTGRKPKNEKKNHMTNLGSNISTQNQKPKLENMQIEPDDSTNQNLNNFERKITQRLDNDFQKDSTIANQTNEVWTNYSSQKSISNQRKRSFSEDQEMEESQQNRFKRKERFSCYVISNQFISELEPNGSLNRQGQQQSISEKRMLANEQKVANQSNHEEGENGFTQPVRESNTNLVKLNGQHQIIVQLDLDNPFNPDVTQHSNQQQVSQQQCVQENMVEESFLTSLKKKVQIPERKLKDFIMEIQMETQMHKFKTEKFQEDSDQVYQQRYEIYLPRNPIDPRINFKINRKIIQGLHLISINCGRNIYRKGSYKQRKKFLNTDDFSAMKQMIRAVIGFMEEGYNFILLQQACDPIFQIMLGRAIEKFNKLGGHLYFYPQHLEKDTVNLRTTTILTRHQVKMGQFKFNLKQFPEYPLYKPYLPIQAFVEFRININGKWQNVCIFNCHLKSSRGHKTRLSKLVRIEQVKAIKKFSKKYDRFFCIGDVNIPSSAPFDGQNRHAQQNFFDATQYGISEIKGTFLYRNRARKVIPQRNDRVWLDYESALTTSVLINYQNIELDSCKGLGLDQTKILQQADYNEFPYITVNDHAILDVEIMFTK